MVHDKQELVNENKAIYKQQVNFPKIYFNNFKILIIV